MNLVCWEMNISDNPEVASENELEFVENISLMVRASN